MILTDNGLTDNVLKNPILGYRKIFDIFTAKIMHCLLWSEFGEIKRFFAGTNFYSCTTPSGTTWGRGTWQWGRETPSSAKEVFEVYDVTCKIMASGHCASWESSLEFLLWLKLIIIFDYKAFYNVFFMKHSRNEEFYIAFLMRWILSKCTIAELL